MPAPLLLSLAKINRPCQPGEALETSILGIPARTRNANHVMGALRGAIAIGQRRRRWVKGLSLRTQQS